MKVGDVIRLIVEDGWRLTRTVGSHRQFRHPLKKGLVTVAGKPSLDVPPGTLRSILKQAGLKPEVEDRVEYVVILERGEKSYGAYVPDLPGCVAVGATREEAARLIRRAIALHLAGLKRDGLPVPEPSSTIESVEV